ncbi:Ca2+ regulator and membrane fusion protein Fig1-domain-containing protein [Talaromyces proteolyticus]|uniref:Ca2+ regulator and membrane fusion protein Fig1-domain-containing protein n=1 Tax=Talaromyces proteolyticus TaxID=1131652 RepID=A0AAD4L0I3_9EURO|nr:Ca2+ regulator and membrane fusion protein Fig1-domain-containing protein [Talaromyces proteolyticus]KAH8705333.1 Ca2+ regulator and membrane fusion protein Fig1-domain-containing protein [Talaromyces proteolyticus]
MFGRRLNIEEVRSPDSRSSEDEEPTSVHEQQQQSPAISQQKNLLLRFLSGILHPEKEPNSRSHPDNASEGSRNSSVSYHYYSSYYSTSSYATGNERREERQRQVWRRLSRALGQFSIVPSRALTAFFVMLGFHHIMMVLVVAILILTCLVLGSCTGSSPTMSHFHLLSLSYAGTQRNTSSVASSLNVVQNLGTEQLNMRVLVGYFAVCVALTNVPSTVSISSLLCSSDGNSLRGSFLEASEDPLGLLDFGFRIKDNIMFPYLSVIATVLELFLLLLLAQFPGWKEETDEDGSEREVKPFPSTVRLVAALALSSVAAALLLVTAVWQQVAAVAAGQTLEQVMPGQIMSLVGLSASISSWFAFGLAAMVFLMVLTMYTSIRILLDRFD